MEIKNSQDFIEFVTSTMEDVKKGNISAASGNAIANLSGKILQMIALEMKAIGFPKLSERKGIALKAITNEETKDVKEETNIDSE